MWGGAAERNSCNRQGTVVRRYGGGNGRKQAWGGASTACGPARAAWSVQAEPGRSAVGSRGVVPVRWCVHVAMLSAWGGGGGPGTGGLGLMSGGGGGGGVGVAGGECAWQRGQSNQKGGAVPMVPVSLVMAV